MPPRLTTKNDAKPLRIYREDRRGFKTLIGASSGALDRGGNSGVGQLFQNIIGFKGGQVFKEIKCK